MRIRITRTLPALRQEIIEGELVVPDPSTDVGWRPAEQETEEAIRQGDPITLLVQSDAGLAVWQSTPVIDISSKSNGQNGMLVKTQNSLCRVEELPPDSNTRRCRRTTGMIPILSAASKDGQ